MFLEYLSSRMLKVKRLESQIILKVFESKKIKGPQT
jgi:hypothetical protein